MTAPIDDQETIFTDDDILFAQNHPILGPEYSAAWAFMDRFMIAWEDEHLKPLADAIAKEVGDKIRDRIWDDFRDHLLVDTEQNAAAAMRGMVNDTVKALLGGQRWALDRYPMAARYDADEIRAAIAKHIPDEIAKARIADLEAELKKAKEDLAWMRR